MTLSVAETKVAELLAKGLTNAEVASILGITEKTVKFHNTAIYKKAGVKSRALFVNKMLSVRVAELEAMLASKV